MTRIVSILLLAALGLVGTAGGSQAAFTVTITGLSGGTVILNSPGLPGTYLSTALNPLQATSFTIRSDATQVGGQASLQSTVSINTTTAPLTTPVTVTISENSYTLPGTTGIKSGSMSVTTTDNPTGVQFSSTVGATPLYAANIGSVAPSSASMTFTPATTTFSAGTQTITQVFSLGTLSQNSTVQISATNIIDTAAVPAPAGVLVAGLGLPLLGLLRRRLA